MFTLTKVDFFNPQIIMCRRWSKITTTHPKYTKIILQTQNLAHKNILVLKNIVTSASHSTHLVRIALFHEKILIIDYQSLTLLLKKHAFLKNCKKALFNVFLFCPQFTEIEGSNIQYVVNHPRWQLHVQS